MVERELPDATYDQTMPDIEISRTAIESMIKRICIDRAVVSKSRLIINGMCICVCTAKIEAVAESLVHGKLELIAAGGAAAQVRKHLQSSRRGRVWVNGITASCQRSGAIGVHAAPVVELRLHDAL